MLAAMMTRALVVLGGLGLCWAINSPYLGDFTPTVILLCLVPPLLLTWFVLALSQLLSKQPANGRRAPTNVTPAPPVPDAQTRLALETLAQQLHGALVSAPAPKRLPPFPAYLGLRHHEIQARLRHWRN
jgi:hypothetical protein